MDNDYFSPNNPLNYWAREADSRAEKAQADAESARNDASFERQQNNIHFETIFKLSAAQKNQEEFIDSLKKDKAQLQSEKDFYKGLLSLPMKEIAEQSGEFKETYEAEQLVLSKWMLSQKAYAETTIQLGLSAGKTKEEIKEIYNDNVAAVLSNTTKHGNDAVTNQVLKENIKKFLKVNKYYRT